MKLRIPQLAFGHILRGTNRVTLGFLLVAVLLHGTAWWLRASEVPFNVVVLNIAGGIVVVNAVLALQYGRSEPLLGYIFGGAAVLAQLFLLILLLMARQGALL